MKWWIILRWIKSQHLLIICAVDYIERLAVLPLMWHTGKIIWLWMLFLYETWMHIGTANIKIPWEEWETRIRRRGVVNNWQMLTGKLLLTEQCYCIFILFLLNTVLIIGFSYDKCSILMRKVHFISQNDLSIAFRVTLPNMCP